MENINKNSNDDDKTIIYSSSKNTTNDDSADKTVVNDNSDKTQIQSPNPPKQQHTESTSASPGQDFSRSEKIEMLKGKGDKSGISPGAAAAGVAAAAVAGTAMGTVYSEEIKGVFDNEEIDAPESIASENSTNDQGTSAEASINSAAALTQNSGNELKTDVASVLEFSTTDDQGNQYTVSLVDLDNDGKIDYQTANIGFVDGSSISYTGSGENMNSLFANNMNWATNEDYVNLQQVSNQIESGATSIYEIQAGDTLSEIALANDTSVSDIMEINPNIQDADLIYAGDEIMIPGGEMPENTIDATTLAGNYYTNEPGVESVDTNYEVSDWASENEVMGETDPSNYDVIDWSSETEVEGEIETSNYEEELANTDFDNFNSVDSFDFDSDFTNTDF
jgi:LysM repeat protein